MRKCCFCEISKPDKLMTRIPRSLQRYNQWARILGSKFEINAGQKINGYICLSHFDLDENGKRKPNSNPKIDSKEESSSNICVEEKNIWREHSYSKHDGMLESVEQAELIAIDNEEPIERRSDLGEKEPDMEISEEIDDSGIDKSYFLSMSDVESSSDDSDVESGKKEEPEQFEYIFVQLATILSLIRRCHLCASEAAYKIVQHGFAIQVKCECQECGKKWDWFSSVKAHTKKKDKREKLFLINLDFVSAMTVVGMAHTLMKELCFTLKIPHLTNSTFFQTRRLYVLEAIRKKYDEIQLRVMQILEERVRKGEKLNISGDGQYDSRGYSAFFVRYVLMEVSSKFIVDFEVMRKDRAGFSGGLEPAAHKKVMQRFVEYCEKFFEMKNTIGSFTSDRCKAVATTMKNEFPSIGHYFDSWHFIRNVTISVWKKKGQVQMRPLKNWIRSFINHLFWSISSSDGDGTLAVEKFMSFFCHIIGIHDNFDKITWFKFEKFLKCEHGPVNDETGFLNPDDKKHNKAWNVMKSIAMLGNRLTDMKRVSPFFATSSVESFNARSCKYCPKDKFFNEEGHEFRSKLTIVDWNSKQLDELNGKRKVLNKKKSYWDKTRQEVKWKYVKSQAIMNWRREILEFARKNRFNEDLSQKKAITIVAADGIDDMDFDVDANDGMDISTDASQFSVDQIFDGLGEEDESFDTEAEEFE